MLDKSPTGAVCPAPVQVDEAGGSRPQPALPRVRAISTTGHTCRGRVRQKSHKSADLVEAGALRCGWGVWCGVVWCGKVGA